MNRGRFSRWVWLFVVGVVGFGAACTIRPLPGTDAPAGLATETPTPRIVMATATRIESATATSAAPDPDTGDTRLYPEDMAYLGAFRLPADPEGMGWEFSGEALACNPQGDAGGPDDGFPGSLFATGHNWTQYVAELSIPAPVIPAGLSVESLNTASMLQDFANVRGRLFDDLEFEIPRAGLAYLAPSSGEGAGVLHFCWGQHMQEGETSPSHGYCSPDLSRPEPAGPWRIGDLWNYATTDYLLEVPNNWADRYAPNMRLATGRFRDGGQGGQGPSLVAYRPPDPQDPPAPESVLDALPLLLYGDAYTADSPTMTDYHHADEWSGAAWLTAGDRSAVVFVGTKGQGECWYGFADGTVWPDEAPYPAVPPPPNDDRGWWSDSFFRQMLFYDPADLARVAQGELGPWEPQPYAVLDVDKWLYHVAGSQQKYHLGAVSFDRLHGLLYVLETLADEDRPLVHVWRVG